MSGTATRHGFHDGAPCLETKANAERHGAVAPGAAFEREAHFANISLTAIGSTP
jgi:hypothetical protein